MRVLINPKKKEISPKKYQNWKTDIFLAESGNLTLKNSPSRNEWSAVKKVLESKSEGITSISSKTKTPHTFEKKIELRLKRKKTYSLCENVPQKHIKFVKGVKVWGRTF